MKFTVLIPTFDNGPVIGNAIESVLDQTCQDFEIFIIGDGALQATLDVANAMAARDARIKVFQFEKGERNGEALRHIALQQASGDAVCYLSDDDLWFPDHLDIMKVLLRDADFAHTRHTLVEPTFELFSTRAQITDAALRQRMLDELANFFGPTAAGHRMDAYRRLPVGWSPAPPDVWTDLHMWRKWIRAEGVRFTANPMITSLHFARSLRPDRSQEAALKESAFLRRLLQDADLREEMAPVERGDLGAIFSRAMAVKAQRETESRTALANRERGPG